MSKHMMPPAVSSQFPLWCDQESGVVLSGQHWGGRCLLQEGSAGWKCLAQEHRRDSISLTLTLWDSTNSSLQCSTTAHTSFLEYSIYFIIKLPDRRAITAKWVCTSCPWSWPSLTLGLCSVHEPNSPSLGWLTEGHNSVLGQRRIRKAERASHYNTSAQTNPNSSPSLEGCIADISVPRGLLLARRRLMATKPLLGTPAALKSRQGCFLVITIN